MSEPNPTEQLITQLATGIANSLFHPLQHPAVSQSCFSFLASLRDLCRVQDKQFVAIRVQEGQIVDEDRVLVAATIRGRKLIELVKSCSAGGLLVGAQTREGELLQLFSFAREVVGPPRPLEQARARLEELGIENIQLSDTDEAGEWYGGSGARSVWSTAGIDLERSIPVYQSMFDAVDGSIQLASSGESVDMNQARSVSEDLEQATRDGFDDILHLAHYPDYDSYTVGHSIRVALFSTYVGTHIGAAEEVLVELGAAALMHDVGKGRIPFEILFKPGKLDEEEWRIMVRHAQLGAEILIESEDVTACAISAAWGHHLRFDGGGYPQTRPWAQSSRVTSLVQVCDVFEALTARRPYKSALTPRRAYEIMLSDQGAFDPAALSLLMQALGLYPPGSFVRLSDGTIGRVRRAGSNFDRPELRVLPTGEVVDLGRPETADLTVSALISEHTALAVVRGDIQPGESVLPAGAGDEGNGEAGEDEDGGDLGLTDCPLC